MLDEHDALREIGRLPNRPPSHVPPGAMPRAAARQEHDRTRGSARERGYDAVWHRMRNMVLAEEPLCRLCGREGRLAAAAEVDHIVPIVRRPDLRLDRGNLQPLCRACHARKTREENAGAHRSPPGA